MNGITGIGDRVSQMMSVRGLTQAELGAALTSNRSQAWVSGVVRGKWMPGFEEAYELASHLGVTPMWLIYGQEAAEESEFVGRLQILEPDLDERARISILMLAESEARQVREAREREAVKQSALSDEEAELVRRWRMTDPEERAALLSGFASEPETQPAEQEAPSVAPPPRPRQERLA